jgi:hypothetical protein
MKRASEHSRNLEGTGLIQVALPAIIHKDDRFDALASLFFAMASFVTNPSEVDESRHTTNQSPQSHVGMDRLPADRGDRPFSARC